MANNKYIEDHNFWGGNYSAEYGCPPGFKVKKMEPGNCAGKIYSYSDTSPMIKRDQDMQVSKTKKNAPKEGYRH